MTVHSTHDTTHDMKIQIKSIAGSVLFEGDFSCIAEAVNAAVKSSANLRSADLSFGGRKEVAA